MLSVIKSYNDSSVTIPSNQLSRLKLSQNDRKRHGFTSVWNDNTENPRLCPKCKQGKKGGKSKVFKKRSDLARHLVSGEHEIDLNEFPSVNTCLVLLQNDVVLDELGMKF